MNYVERLNEALKLQLRHPWLDDRSGGERVWFLVIEPTSLRNVMFKSGEFNQTIESQKRKWVEIDVSKDFGFWMDSHPYKESMFSDEEFDPTISDDFFDHLRNVVIAQMRSQKADESTVTILVGTESFYGIISLSSFVRAIEDETRGRLLVFFPGTYRDSRYKFMSAREGWNYLAVPIAALER